MRQLTLALVVAAAVCGGQTSAQQQLRRFLYVATPGAEHPFEYQGAGIFVYDIDNGHRFVRRIPTWPVRDGEPLERVRGLAAHAATRRLYVSTVRRLAAFDLVTEKMVWEQAYDGQCCDRIAVSPDGAEIYAPAFGGARWRVVRASDGAILATIDLAGWAREAVFASDGGHAFLRAWESRVLTVVDPASRRVVREIGPFTSFVCPVAIDRRALRVYANVDGLVGFEVGDLQTGLVLDRVEVGGYEAGLLEKFECPSHGIALAPGERELWVADGVDNRLHVFDASTYPPAASATVAVRAQPRWVTFGIDGRYVYPSSGDVIDAATKEIVTSLEDEHGAYVQSEKMLEVEFSRGIPVRAGNP